MSNVDPAGAASVPDNPATLSARAVVSALVAAGVRDVVLAPGSRSAPLAYALHEAERIGWLRVIVRIDERSAGFVAVGIARHRPVAVVTTSGTAVANLHPAVLEASHSGLPVVVLSADRPHEVRGVGANQTTDQARLFGGAVRWHADIPAADDAATAARGVAATVTRAVVAATGVRSDHPGPVHLNIGFRPPLTPDASWVPGEQPEAIAVEGRLEIAPIRLDRGPRTVIVAGDGGAGATGPAGATGATSPAALADATGWPILAEPTSSLRGHPHALAAPSVLADVLAPEIERVVVLGRPTLSRAVTALLAREDLHIVVAGRGPQWVDVAGTASLVAGSVDVVGVPAPAEQQWLARCAVVSDRARAALDAALDGGRVTGPLAARELLGAGTGQGTIVLGSSMAIRDADLAAPVGQAFTGSPVIANRGLSGIDGTVSTAVGVALATDAPVRALLGDLTFQHDLGGLAIGPLERDVDVQLLVLNDDGGSIFATLEHGRPEYERVYTRMFGTPQGLGIADLAAGFGAAHMSVTDPEELAAALAEPVRGRSVVEVPLDSATARERGLDLVRAVREAAA